MTPFRANLFLLIAALFWGLGNVAQKTVLDELGPLTSVGLRCLIGAIVLLPFVRREFRISMKPAASELRGLGEIAVLFAAAIVIQQIAFATTTVTNASFLLGTTTVITPLMVWLLFKTRLSFAIWTAVFTAFTGAVLMSGGAVSAFAPGDFACLISAIAYSLWFVRLGQFVGKTGRPGLVTVAQFALTGVACLSLGLIVEPISPSQLTAALPELLFLGVFSTGLAYGLQAIAQQYATPCTAAILTSAESVFGAAAAALILSETLTPLMWIGAILVIIAILTVQLAPAARPRSSAVRPAG